MFELILFVFAFRLACVLVSFGAQAGARAVISGFQFSLIWVKSLKSE